MDRLPLYRCPLHARVEGSCLQAGSARWHRGFLTRWLAVAPRRSDRAVLFRLSKKSPPAQQASIDSISPSRCASDTHTYLHSNIEISYQIFPSDRRKIYISAYTFREQNSSSRRTQPPRISFGHVRGPNHSVPGGGRGSATLSVFLPLSFQSTASERRGVTCLRCIRFRVNQIIDKACAIDQRFFSRKFTSLNII